MRKLPGWGIHVRTIAKCQSFNWFGAALLQNIGSRVWCSHTVCLSVQGGFLTVAFCTTSKRGAEICLLLWAPGGSPSLKLWKGWLFPVTATLQIQLLPRLAAASSLAGVFCFVLVCACEHTMDCAHKIWSIPSCQMLMCLSLRVI